jgi:hypothetical protein
MFEQRYRFDLEGISPLLMHWDNIEWADQLKIARDEIKQKDKANFSAGDDRCPPHTWKGYTYNDDKHVVMPMDNLRACLLKAGARVTLSKQKSFKELTQCGILFEGFYATFLNNGKQIEWSAIDKIKGNFAAQSKAAQDLGFSLFVKRATVGQAKHVRVRPRFSAWSVQGEFLVVDEQVTDEVLESIWHIAGFYIGLCDWRPGSKTSPGPFGRSKAVLTKV